MMKNIEKINPDNKPESHFYLINKIGELINHINFLYEKIDTLEKTKAKKQIVYGDKK